MKAKLLANGKWEVTLPGYRAAGIPDRKYLECSRTEWKEAITRTYRNDPVCGTRCGETVEKGTIEIKISGEGVTGNDIIEASQIRCNGCHIVFVRFRYKNDTLYFTSRTGQEVEE